MRAQVEQLRNAFTNFLDHVELVNKAALDHEVDLQAGKLQLEMALKELRTGEDRLAARQAEVKKREDALDNVRELAASRLARVKTLEAALREAEQKTQEERTARLKVENDMRKLKAAVPELLLARTQEAAVPAAVGQ